MPKNPNDYPVGTIILEPGKTKELNTIYRVVSLRGEEGKKTFKAIGNFFIDCLARGVDNLGETQYLLNVNGELKICDKTFITTPTSFKEFIRPHTWFGSAEDTEELAKIIFENIRTREDDNFIILRDFVGFYSHPKIEFWVFEELILITKENGEKCFKKVLLPKNKIFRLEQLDLWISISEANINSSLIPAYVEPEDYTLEEFLDDWLSQIKNKALLYLLIGWNISSLFLERVNICRKSRFFPFFVITAATESGKTSLLSNCINMFGVRYIGENFAASVTRFVEMVEFSRVSHIPIWRDEYKNEKYALEKEGWLRSVYTRSKASRGDKDQSVRQYLTNATLLLSGEDITEDPALSRRMIKMRLRQTDKIDKELYQASTVKARSHFPMAFPLILKHDFDEKVFSEIFDNPENTIPNDTDQKDELMCCASVGAIFGIKHGLKAIEAVREYHLRSKDEIANTKQATVEDFASALHSIFVERGWYESQFNQKPKVLDYFHFPDISQDGTPVAWFQFPPLHSLVNKNRAQGEYRWTKKAIGQLILETYNAKNEPRRLGSQSMRVMIIENFMNFTDAFGDLLASAYATQKAWKEKNAGLDTLEPI